MRQLITVEDFRRRGLTREAIRAGERAGKWRRIERGVYGEGPDAPTNLDRARAAVLATGGVAGGRLTAVLRGLDGVVLDGPDVTIAPGANGRRPGVRRRLLPPERIVEIDGIRCVDGLQTMIDLAAQIDDLVWEQALESALRRRLVSIEDLEQVAGQRFRGAPRMRRVLKLRPVGARPTESLLETLMVQLARLVPGLPPPTRQLDVFDENGSFVARVDLAWPEFGLFIELDGQHHEGQPVYDAFRETAVVAATGWLCGRFTWHEVVRLPNTTARRLARVVDQARARPAAS